MIRGLIHFLQASFFLLGAKERRQWLIGQFFRALGLGLILLVAIFGILAGLFSYLFQHFQFEGYWSWLAGAGFGLLWLLLFILGVAPVALIGASVYLSERANWGGLNQSANNSFEKKVPTRSHPLWKSLLLVLLVLLVLPFGFIPFLAWINLAVAAYALGQEWIWAAEEHFGVTEPPVSLSYRIGLGLIPALCSIVPILGVLSLPFLQTAALWRYRGEK